MTFLYCPCYDIIMWAGQVIKKNKEELVELLVFDVLDNFRQVYQSDINISGEIELRWASDEKLSVNKQEYDLK